MEQILEFVRWMLTKGVDIHLGIAIEASSLGGFGLVCQNQLSEDTIVLRIPPENTFDLNTLLGLTQQMKDSDKSGSVARIINTTLTSGSYFTETAIVCGYIWALRALQAMAAKTTLEVSGIDVIAKYLDILASTETLNVDEDIQDSDHLVQSQIKEKRRVRAEYEHLVESLPEVEELLPFDEAYQLHQAVKSRVLEIPHAISAPSRGESDEEDEDEEEDDDQDNFTTNVTLVPVLDFANHSSDNNAVFDVDRETLEVILKLQRDVATGEEICISYSPTDALDVFFRTYGFIPQSLGSFKWKIPNLNEVVNENLHTKDVNYQFIAKWLHISPYLRVIVSRNGTISLDLADFRLPLLMIPGLQYNENWPEKVNIEELSGMYHGSTEEIVEELRKQESSSDVVYGTETAYGVTWQGQEVVIPNIIEQTSDSSEDAVTRLIESTIPVIRDAITRTLVEDQLSAERHHNSELSEYYAYKRKLLEQVKTFEIGDLMQMIEGVYDVEV